MAAKKEVQVVKDLDLQRYMGRWYEIASMPSRFQPKNSINTTANYTLKDDGAPVEVLNETFTDGGKKRATIQGTAYKVDPSSPDAKFKVRFMVPPFLPIIPVTGDYWVLLLDHDSYNWALVGEPSRSSLWILCREKHMDEETYNRLLEHAREQGYDLSHLGKTPQSDEPLPTEAPNDKVGLWWIKSIFGK